MMELEVLHKPVITDDPCLWERRKGRCLQKQDKIGGVGGVGIINFLTLLVKISPWISLSFSPISYPGHLSRSQMLFLVGQVLPLWYDLGACH